MEEDCGGGQGLSWAVEPRRERDMRRKYPFHSSTMELNVYGFSARYQVAQCDYSNKENFILPDKPPS
jgi:hypothetical protein